MMEAYTNIVVFCAMTAIACLAITAVLLCIGLLVLAGTVIVGEIRDRVLEAREDSHR